MQKRDKFVSPSMAAAALLLGFKNPFSPTISMEMGRRGGRNANTQGRDREV